MTLSVADFELAGFSQRDTGSRAESWVKRFRVEASPYLHEQVEDEDILGTMLASATLVKQDAGWFIQLAIDEADYKEDALALDSEEGEAVFRDAATAPFQPAAAFNPQENRDVPR